MSRTLVIAEPGCTHEGEKAVLLQLLETAHACGADVFKPQWTSDPIAMCERRHIRSATYSYYLSAYSWLAFPLAWHQELRDRCHALGMEYACSVYLSEDVAAVAPFVDYLKISSFEAQDAALLTEAARHARVIVSTGMMAHFEAPPQATPWALLHCVTAYPTPIQSLNLSVLQQYDGFSDHSEPAFTWVGALAVAAGATIIEAHYRLDDCNPENPDYAVARSPRQFEDYIRHIRFAEACLGTPEKQVQACELPMLSYRVTG